MTKYIKYLLTSNIYFLALKIMNSITALLDKIPALLDKIRGRNKWTNQLVGDLIHALNSREEEKQKKESEKLKKEKDRVENIIECKNRIATFVRKLLEKYDLIESICEVAEINNLDPIKFKINNELFAMKIGINPFVIIFTKNSWDDFLEIPFYKNIWAYGSSKTFNSETIKHPYEKTYQNIIFFWEEVLKLWNDKVIYLIEDSFRKQLTEKIKQIKIK